MCCGFRFAYDEVNIKVYVCIYIYVLVHMATRVFMHTGIRLHIACRHLKKIWFKIWLMLVGFRLFSINKVCLNQWYFLCVMRLSLELRISLSLSLPFQAQNKIIRYFNFVKTNISSKFNTQSECYALDPYFRTHYILL